MTADRSDGRRQDGAARRRRVWAAAACGLLSLLAAAPDAARAQAAAGVQSAASTAARAASSAKPAGPESLSHGLFRDVQIWRPAGEVKQFVLLLSGADGINAEDRERARHMVAAGAMVAGINVPQFYPRLEAEGGQCSFADGAFENLSHHVQAQYKLPTYLTPLLVGREGGATLAYAMLAQAQPGTFAGALSIGFCPRLTNRIPLCKANALSWTTRSDGPGIDLVPALPLSGPWIALQRPQEPSCPGGGDDEFIALVPQARRVDLPAADRASRAASSASTVADATMPQFSTAYAELAVPRAQAGAPPAGLADLPIVEMPDLPGGAAGSAADRKVDKRFAILLSGDGGWAGLAKGVAGGLVQAGIPVAGFDSLRYFWTARTPDDVARDLDRVIRYYAARWKRSEVLVIGYSQGADVLPFAINRLPAATRERIGMTTLLGLGQKASFEFHVTNWLGPSGDRPIAPEASKLQAATTLCVHGTDEKDSLCPQLGPQHVTALALPGNHHFGGKYDALAGLILQQAAKH